MTKKSSTLNRRNLGFLLAKALQSWNARLHQGFRDRGFQEVRPSFGSVLIPLYEQDGQKLGDLAQRGRISKQTMTTLIRQVEAAGLVRRAPDPEDGRATRVMLTEKARRFAPVAEEVLKQLDAKAKRIQGAQRHDDLLNWLEKFIDT